LENLNGGNRLVQLFVEREQCRTGFEIIML